MKKISSKFTGLYKRGFPIFWFGLLLVITVGPYWTMTKSGEFYYPFFVTPAIMALVGYLIMKALIFDLVDEIRDHGGYLIVINRGKEQRIMLPEIMNVSISTFVNPTRMVLRLRTAGPHGQEIAFIPISEFSFNPLHRPRIYEELIGRIDKARFTDRT